MTQPRLLGGRYELDGIVGRGGMAEVFRARDIRLDRVVAVKTLRDDLARDATFQARFRREAQSAASLNHPSVVAVYDTGEDMSGSSHVPYIVMEYVDGRTLRDLLRDDRRLLPERALEITDGVLRALDYSHRSGIVHRDIKPGNVMLTRNGEVKVMDFGIARAVSDAQATMTQTAQVIGTAQYLSPEQARGERVDARSDLYSTGCLLYELLTGRPPFLGDSPVAIAYQHVRENPVPPSRLDPEIPPWADSIVLRAMAKDPAQRYQSAAEMRTDIQRALSGVPVAAPRGMGYATTQRMGASGATMAVGSTRAIPGYEYGQEEDEYPDDGGGSRRRTWLWWALGVLLVLAVLGGVAYAFFGGSGGVAVPQVNGLPVNQATQQVTKAGLVAKVVKEANPTVPKGTVISTSPANGSLVAKGTTVTLKVSNGPPQVTVPSVIHKPEPVARSTLEDKGFQVNEVTAQNSTAKPNTVVRQNPTGGTSVNKGATVTLFISPSGAQVPDVVNEQVAIAQGQLANAGFTHVQIQEVSSPGLDDGIVTQQNPTAGQTVPTSTVITLTVVKNEPTPTPTTSSPSPSPSPSVSSSTPSGNGGGGGGAGGTQSQVPGNQRRSV
ncbi:MAG TPA: Stk1 family PASTA domain-containing Ser/Thr kinase [Streptosporangiaceae bacterium]|nr:Stk1 family PASTA domain-containing Ser/Thr kinase [Streptosporangiaceae bacterium]